MVPRRGLSLALVCIIALSSVHRADAFWGLGKKNDVSGSDNAKDGSKSTPASSPSDAHLSDHSEQEHGERHDDAEEHHQHDFDDVNHDHYWYNEVTKESQWEYPTYEFKDGEEMFCWKDCAHHLH